MGSQNNLSKKRDNRCHRCGFKSQQKNEFWASEHFVRLYQNFLKEKEIKVASPLLMHK